jgi:predicted small lipoprotein YifL
MAYSVAAISPSSARVYIRVKVQMFTNKSILLVCICSCMLAACGNKGSLFLPEEGPDSKPVVTPEATNLTDPLDRDEDKEKDGNALPPSA